MHLVDGCWKIENLSASPQLFTVLPDGCFKVLCTRELGQEPRFTLSGVWTHAFEITVAAHATIVGIRFRLLAAEHLFPRALPLNSAQLLPPDCALSEVLLTPDLPLVAERLAAQVALWQPNARKRALFAALYQGAGSRSVAELAAAAAWSPRQINRYFQAQFGLSLKAYSNVLRSYAAAQHLQPDNLFAAGNYYDQSHGIREIKKHTGASPRQLDQHRHDRFIQLCPPQAPDLCATSPPAQPDPT
jgi:AraC-like DNA-binding protein